MLETRNFDTGRGGGGGSAFPRALLPTADDPLKGLAVDLLIADADPEWALRRRPGAAQAETNASVTVGGVKFSFNAVGTIQDNTGPAGNNWVVRFALGTNFVTTTRLNNGINGEHVLEIQGPFDFDTGSLTINDLINDVVTDDEAPLYGFTAELVPGADGTAVATRANFPAGEFPFTGGADASFGIPGVPGEVTLGDLIVKMTGGTELATEEVEEWSAQLFTSSSYTSASIGVSLGNKRFTLRIPPSPYTWGQALTDLAADADSTSYGLTYELAAGTADTDLVPLGTFSATTDFSAAVAFRPAGSWAIDEEAKLVEVIQFPEDADNTVQAYLDGYSDDLTGIKLTRTAGTATTAVIADAPEAGEVIDRPFGVWGYGSGSGSGGPAVNTVGWFTAYQAATADDAVLLIARITADEALDGETRELPIITDRIGWGENTAVIERVENIADQKFTTLSLAGPLGAAVDAGEVIRIDRLQYAEVARDTVDGATVAHTGATQPTITWPGAAAGNSVTITYKTSNGHHLGTANNGTTLELDTGDESNGANYNLSKTQFTLRMTEAAPTLNELKQALDHYLGGYFSTAVTGDGTDTVDLSQDTRSFAGGVDATDGTISVALHAAYPNVQVDDFIFFKTSPEVKRKITGVAHTASETTLTLETRLDSVISDDTAVRIDREIGYNEATASVRGAAGAGGSPGASGVGPEFIYASSADGTAIAGAANLPDPDWNYHEVADAGTARGTETYYRGTPTDVSSDRPYVIRFRRQVPGAPADNTDVGTIAWTQEAALRYVGQDGADSQVPGPAGPAGQTKVYAISYQKNNPSAGDNYPIGNGSSDIRSGAPLFGGKIINIAANVILSAAESQVAGTATFHEVRLWKNDASDVTNFLAECRFDFDGQPAQRWHSAVGTMYSGTVSSTTGAFNNEEQITEVEFDAGDVIIVTYQQQASGLSAPQFGDVTLEISREIGDAAPVNNPRGYWWLDGATERDSGNFPYTLGAVPAGETRTTALKFRTNDPDEQYDDPDSALDDILVATASVSSDKDTTVVGGNERTVFSLPVGRYDFLFSLESAKSMEEAHFRLFKIESGVDEDRGVGAVFPMGQNENQPQGSMQARIPDIVVDDATDQWYAAVVGHDQDNSNTTVRGFMAIEKRA